MPKGTNRMPSCLSACQSREVYAKSLEAYQSKIADARLVVHHCDKPFLKSSPRSACGSSSALLQPLAVQAGR